MKFNRNWPHRRIEIGRLRTQFQCFGANFADRWPSWTGAHLIKVHLHSKSFGGALKWPLKGGSRLIQVAATAGLTVVLLMITENISLIKEPQLKSHLTIHTGDMPICLKVPTRFH